MAISSHTSVIPRLAAPQLLLVVNAHASGARRGVVADVEAELRRWGGRLTTLVTESPAEWIEACQDDPERRLVLVGGDGTLHAAARATSTRPEIALVPAGRANNVAHSLGIPLSPRAAAQLAVEGVVRPIDLIEAGTPAGTRITVEAVSIGFLADARARYHGDNSADVGAALAAGVHALAAFQPLHARVTLGGEATVDLELTQLFVANLPLYGFGLHVAPEADPTDELLDLVAFDARGRLAIPSLIGRLRLDHGLSGADVHHWLTQTARIELRERSPIVADSFELGSESLDVRVLPKSLQIVRP